jgi:hypothetical protein
VELSQLQSLLERIYGVSVSQQVDDFLVTDAAVAAQLDTSADARVCDEKLLVAEELDALAVSLFIDEGVMSRLRDDNPWEHLHENNLNDFCTALEGVSHFLYLINRAHQSRPVTLLEMELQAEVDKYVVALSVLKSQGLAATPGAFLSRLFHEVRFAADLNAEERQRYESANSLAGRYCGHLETRFLSARSRGEYYDELRRFYRMSQADKLQRIAATG